MSILSNSHYQDYIDLIIIRIDFFVRLEQQNYLIICS